MKQPAALFATLATGLALGCILTGLAVSANQQDLCDNPALVCGLNQTPGCDIAATPPRDAADRPTPTLAPPRPAAADGPSSNEVAKGQPVFVNIETDQNELEVGWATP